MQTTNTDAVATTIRQCLALRAPTKIDPDADIGGDQNLLELLDSFSFVELIFELEDKLGIEIDLADTDLSEIVHFQNLTQFVSQQRERSMAGSQPH